MRVAEIDEPCRPIPHLKQTLQGKMAAPRADALHVALLGFALLWGQYCMKDQCSRILQRDSNESAPHRRWMRGTPMNQSPALRGGNTIMYHEISPVAAEELRNCSVEVSEFSVVPQLPPPLLSPMLLRVEST